MSTFNNTTSGTELRQQLAESFLEIFRILSKHSGPFAGFAAIGARDRQLDSADEHTKDGIKILSHMLSDLGATDRYAARTTRFIGKAIDGRVHDGTTTAMSLFAMLASQVMNFHGSRRQLHQRARQLRDCLNYLRMHLNAFKITVDDIYNRVRGMQQGGRLLDVCCTHDDIRRALAYHQAMIASKGDHEMSVAIAEVIVTTPIRTYNQFLRKSADYETDKRISLETKPYELTVRGSMGSVGAFNINLGTEFRVENALVYATPEMLNEGAFDTTFLNALIGIHSQDTKNRGVFGLSEGWWENHNNRRLVIVCNCLTDHRLMTNIQMFNSEHPENPIVWMNLGVDDILLQIFDRTLHALAGTPCASDVPTEERAYTILQDVTVSFKKDTIRFENLYKKDGHALHPFTRDETLCKTYTDFKRELEGMLEFAEQHPNETPFNGDQRNFLVTMYRYLTCQTITDVVIGGTVHENFSLRTVYDDAMGSAMSSVNDGVILGGYGHMVRIIHDLSKKRSIPFRDEARAVFMALITVLQNSFGLEDVEDLFDTSDAISEAIRTRVRTKWNYLVVDPDKIDKDFEVAFFGVETLRRFFDLNPSTPILFQPYSGFEEQLLRFADILPKLTEMSVLIDMGHLQHVERNS